MDLTAAWQAARLAWPALRAAGGSVVLVGSIVGSSEGSLRSPAYAAAKAGLEGLGRSLALIGAKEGIRVNVLAPGAFDTPFDEKLVPARTPGRTSRSGAWARPDEVAGVIAFLLSAKPSYVSGVGVARRRRPHGRSPRPRRPASPRPRSTPSLEAAPRRRRRRPAGVETTVGPWTPHARREVGYRNPWLTVWHDDVTRPDGSAGHLRRRPLQQQRRGRRRHRRPGPGGARGPAPLRLRPALAGRSRRVARRWTRTPLEGAQRELLEETGADGADLARDRSLAALQLRHRRGRRGLPGHRPRARRRQEPEARRSSWPSAGCRSTRSWP